MHVAVCVTPALDVSRASESLRHVKKVFKIVGPCEVLEVL